jgi:hypothetical protein
LNLFDHLVGEREQPVRHTIAGRLGVTAAREGQMKCDESQRAEAELLTAASGGPFRCLP